MTDSEQPQLDPDLRLRLSQAMLGQSLRPAKDTGEEAPAEGTLVMDEEEQRRAQERDAASAGIGLPKRMTGAQEWVLLPLSNAPEGVIGFGGEGTVYSYVQRELGREVAVKTLRADRWSYEAIENLVREACVTARLEHPNIVPVHCLHLAEHDGDLPYWVMKRVRGKALTEHLPSGSDPWPIDRLLDVFRRVLDAIAFAHSKGIVHRDLKPDNILVGEFGEVQVTDWGLAVAITEEGAQGSAPSLGERAPTPDSAHQLGPEPSRAGRCVLSPDLEELNESVRSGRLGALLNTNAGGRAGTPVYMAPEQLDIVAGSVGERTDVFLLGGVLYAMLTGVPPHQLTQGDETAAVRQRAEEIRSCGTVRPIEDARGSPGASDGLSESALVGLRSIVDRALRPEPEERFESAAALTQALDEWESRSASQELSAQASDGLKEARSAGRRSASAYAEVLALADASLEQWADNEDAQHIREQASSGLAAIQRKSTRRLWIAVAASVLVVLAGAAGWVQYLDAKVQRAIAGTEEKKAKQAAKEEAEQRLVAEAAEKTAVAALGKEKEARNAEAEARKRAEAAEKAAVAALDKEKEARNAEAEARKRAEAAEKTAVAALDKEKGSRHAEAEARKRAEAAEKTAVAALNNEKEARSAEAQARKEAEKQRGRAQAEERKAKEAAKLLAKQLDEAYSEAYQKFVDRGDSVGRLLVAVTAQDHARKSNIVDTSRRWQEEIWSSWDLCPHLIGMTSKELPWTDIAFSPDGKLFAAASEEGTIKLWDVVAGVEIAQTITHTSPIRCICFSPDSRILAFGGRGSIELWDTATRTGASSVRLRAAGNVSAEARSLSFTPDGTVLAAGVSYSSGGSRALLWDVQDGHGMPSLRRAPDSRLHTGMASVVSTGRALGVDRTHCVAFGPAGEVLVSVPSADRAIRLWSVGGRLVESALRLWRSERQSAAQRWTTGSASMKELRGHGGDVNCVALSPDGAFLASGSSDGTVMLWDLASGELLRTLRGHEAGVVCLAFSLDSTRLAVATQDGSVTIWAPSTGRQKATLRAHGGAVRSIALSPDGGVLASTGRDKAIKIWQLRDGLAAGLLQGKDLETPVLGVSFASDGVTLASTGGRAESVCLWDTTVDRLLCRLGGGRAAINCLAYGPRRRTLAVGGQNGAVVLWNAATRRKTAELKGHRGGVSCFSFSPDGRSLASTGYSDSAIRLWDTLSGQQEATLGERLGRVWSLSFGTDGAMLASGYDNGFIRLWNVAARKSLGVIEAHTGKKVLAVAFSPDGRLLASSGSDNQVKIWDLASRSERRTLKGHLADVNCVAFSRDGRWVASASSDHTVKLWDPETGLLRADLRGHSERVTCLDFSPNGKLLASGSDDRRVRLWHVPAPRPLTMPDVARLTAGRLDGFGVVHAGDPGAAPREGSRLRFSAWQ